MQPVMRAAIPRMEAAVKAYPFADDGSYRLWPGPNSNTFVATVLRAMNKVGMSAYPALRQKLENL